MNPEEPRRWRAHGTPVPLEANGIHVWRFGVDVAPDSLAALEETLSELERERAEKFTFHRDRHRFVGGRGFLRAALSNYLCVKPGEVEFQYDDRGKPRLGPPFDNSGIHFNLAHSEDLALLAITTIGPVGIDLEHIRLFPDVDDVILKCFSAREVEWFRHLSPEQKPWAFFSLWTHKEAFLKATGAGITRLLPQVEFSFRPMKPPRLRSIMGNSEEARCWSMHDLALAPGFAAALAIRARNVRLCCRHYTPNWFPAPDLVPAG
ncbi:MAG: 4'-phosphopantetheinyl transferase superfamily protein [Verrucomicrobiae bacterium]|nr:4'-phosphopantetheinyl transferase superfamily protein [Verrucomicrobiae bacterium]